ncbi:hypothetical protein WMF31_05625 [Sorangium sp. So ce1036]|uniref:hypothetical protein n=1 Tax=Sorangium sp. So ce1036 TaxID=3133328 RepID=UPI003F02B14F
MSVQYSLLFKNNSVNTGSACVYQTDPDITDPNVMSLAWFAQGAAPTTEIVFTWTVDYSFTWAQTGVLKPGVRFTASQTWPADLSKTNQVTFTNQGGIYTFTNQTTGARAGSLYITEDGSIPINSASVGIGMSGKGTFAVQAQPNQNLIFTPHPKYWITFGSFQPGQVLDVTRISNPVEVDFPPNVYSMTAILNRDNSWTVDQTSRVNAAFLDAQEEHGELAAWGQNVPRVGARYHGFEVGEEIGDGPGKTSSVKFRNMGDVKGKFRIKIGNGAWKEHEVQTGGAPVKVEIGKQPWNAINNGRCDLEYQRDNS